MKKRIDSGRRNKPVQTLGGSPRYLTSQLGSDVGTVDFPHWKTELNLPETIYKHTAHSVWRFKG